MHRFLLFGFLIFISLNLSATTITVTNHNDSGNGSLRNAVSGAANGDVIIFSNSLSGDSILLSTGEIGIDKHLTIQGPGADKLTISASGNSRIFRIDSGYTVSIEGLKMQLGQAKGTKESGNGGAILNKGILNLIKCYISYSKADNSGGAVFNSGELYLDRSTLAYNKADSNGGAIANENAYANMVNSTISRNHALKRGGGIYNKSLDNTFVPVVEFSFSTVTENRSEQEGGGIANTFDYFKDTSMIILGSTIIAGNEAGTYGVDIYRGLSSRCIIQSLGFNMVGNFDSSGIQGSTGDILGNTTSLIEPLLMSLGYWGNSVPFHPLDCGSPALDSGDPFSTMTLDQAGNSRPYAGTNDIGAFESQIDLYIPFVYLGDDIDTCIGTSLKFSVTTTNTVNWYVGYQKYASDTGSFEFISTRYDSVIAEEVSPAGCSGYDTVIVQLQDLVKPVISACPADVTAFIYLADCKSTASWTPPTASDNCHVDTIIGSYAPGDTFDLGTTVVTYRAYDDAGNYDSCTFKVIVKDTIRPVISCPGDIYQDIDSGLCGAVISYTPPVGIDNCELATTKMITGLDSGAFFPAGITVVTYVASDPAGNSDSCSFWVIVRDTVFPSISCPSDVVVNTDAGQCGANVSFTEPSGTDNCTGLNTQRIEGNAPGSFFPIGVTTQKYIVTDISGNTDTCSFTISVLDKEAPVINCPSDIESCDPVVDFSDPAFLDNCTGATISQIAGPVSGSIFSVGATEIVYLAEDPAGNQDTCRFHVIIYPTPEVDLGDDKEIFYGDTFTFIPYVKEASSYEWSPSDYLDDAFSKNPIAQPEEDILYVLTATSDHNCINTDSINIKVRYEFIIPSGFTPGDGNQKNDVWDIKGIIKFPDAEVQIYDRWGKQLFYSRGYQEKWDGTFEGKDLPMDTYYYIVNLNDGTEPYTGTITLIR